MKSRSLILLVGAITLATGTALVARALLRPPPPVTIVKEVPAPTPPPQQVLVAGRALSPGQFIDGAALAWQTLAPDAVRADNVSANDDGQRREREHEFYGATLRHPVAAGQPLTRDLFVYPGNPGFLAAVLAPGMRAVSIPTSMVASNAGLVSAGDRVDVILSLSREQMAAPSIQPNSVFNTLAAQTILHDVRVLALNSDAASIAPTLASRPSGEDKDGENRRGGRSGGQRPIFDSVTLEVSPAEAEQLALTREVGTLQLALRGDGDGDGDDAAAVREHEVTRLHQATEIFGESPRPLTVQTFRGNEPGAAVFADTP